MKKNLVLALALLSGVGSIQALGFRDLPKIAKKALFAGITASTLSTQYEAARDALKNSKEEMKTLGDDALAKVAVYAGSMAPSLEALQETSRFLAELSKEDKKNPGIFTMLHKGTAAKVRELSEKVQNLEEEMGSTIQMIQMIQPE